MEAATKKKRGRPTRFGPEAAAAAAQKPERRTANNRVYALLGLTAGADALRTSPENFYREITGKSLPTGRQALQRQGIFEQLGRCKMQDNAADDRFRILVLQAIDLCQEGISAKAAEQILRMTRTGKTV